MKFLKVLQGRVLEVWKLESGCCAGSRERADYNGPGIKVDDNLLPFKIASNENVLLRYF